MLTNKQISLIKFLQILYIIVIIILKRKIQGFFKKILKSKNKIFYLFKENVFHFPLKKKDYPDSLNNKIILKQTVFNLY